MGTHCLLCRIRILRCEHFNKVLKVGATPTFFVNGETLKGSMSFEELDQKIKSLLKK